MQTCHDNPTGLLGNKNGELTLRICGTARDGQLLRIGSDRCSLGSHPECTIRLRSGDVQPVHCVILRGQRGTAVRRWSPDTRLNGQAFDDAWLSDGDRLSVGPFEFDVVSVASEADDRNSRPSDEQHPDEPTIDWTARQAEWEAAVATLQDELVDLRQELQSATADIEEAKQREQLWFTERTELKQQLEELKESANQREELAQQITQLVAEKDQWREELHQLSNERDEFTQQIMNLESDNAEWRKKVDCLSNELEQRDAELKSVTETVTQQQSDEVQQERNQLTEEWQTFQREREQWEAQRQQAEADLAMNFEQLKLEQQQWTEQQELRESQLANELLHSASEDFDASAESALDSLRHTEVTDPEQFSFQPPSDLAPQDACPETADLGHTQVWEAPADEAALHAPETHQPSATPYEPEASFLEVATAEQRAGGSDNEESIEDYMSRLLQRVRGTSSETDFKFSYQTPRIESVPVDEPVAVADEPAEADAADDSETPTTDQPSESEQEAEFAPRRQAPEHLSSMAAMRELANETTQQAITVNDRHRQKAGRAGKVTVAVVSLIVAVILFNMKSVVPVALYSSALMMVISLYFATKALLMHKSPNKKSNSREESKEVRDATTISQAELL